MRVGASSRVTATTNFLKDIGRQCDGDQALERIILRVADPREYLDKPEKGRAVRESLNEVLSAEGLALTMVGDKMQLNEKCSDGVSLKAFADKVALLDFDTVQRDFERALGSLKDDPEDAVTSACSLIEAVCRSILIELHLQLPAKKDIDGLVRAVQKPLGLSPGRSDLNPEIEEDVRQILGGLTSVTKGIGALRTHGGDAHGREKGYRRIDSRIARLSINSASCLAMFLIETWEQNHHRALKLHKDES